MPVIESKMIMRLQDEMSGNAAKVATALDKVKGAEQGLAVQAGKLNDATRKLRDFGRLDTQLNETSAALEKNRERLKALGSAILATDGPTKGLEKQYRAVQKTVDALTGKLDVQRKAVVEVGAAFEKLSGAPIHSMASAEQRLRVDIDATTDAIKRQMTASTEVRRVEERNAQRRQAIADLKTNVGMLAGPAVLHATEEGVRSGATVQHERVRLRQLGKSITDEQIAEIERNSLDIAAKFKTVTQADMMHMQRNAVTILGDVEEAMEIAEPMAKLRVIADAQHPGQSSDEDFDQFIKGLEIGGATKDPKKFESYMDGIARGLNAFGDTVKPSQYYEMFKYGRGATPMLSQDFMLSIAPSLGGELGGSSFGKAVSGFEQTIVSGRMKKQSGQQFAHLGLVRPQDLQEGAGGEVSVKKGASIKGWQLAQADPFEWVRTVLLPAIEKKGIRDPQQQAKIVGQLFGDSTVQQLVSIMLMQKDRILKDQRIVKGAKGSESYKDYLSDDAFPALAGLGTALKTFTGTLTAPGIERAAHVMDFMSTELGHLSKAYGEFAAEHPHMAEAIGDLTALVAAYKGLKLSYQLGAGVLKTLTGGGASAALAGSATALDGSAVALDKSALSIEAAAGRLGMGGAVTTVEGAAEKKAGGILSRLAPVLPYLGPAGVVIGGTAVVGGVLASGDPTKALLSGGRPDDLTVNDNNLMLPGFATGGFTGAGGRNDPAGTVHKGEYVFDADATSRFFRIMEVLHGGNIRLPSITGTGGALEASPSHVALAVDSTSSAMLHAVMAGAVYDALRRIKGEGGLGGEGGEGGLFGGGATGGGVPNLRYGSGADGHFRATPGGRGSGGGGVNAYTGTGASIGPGDGTATTQDAGPGFTSGMRARNLGNIGYFRGMKAGVNGLVGPSNSRDVDHSIALYATQEDGVRAAAHLALRKYQSGMRNTWDLIAGRPENGKATLKGAWTPGSLGGGASVNIAKAMGLSNRDDLHLDQPEMMHKFLRGLAMQEHGSAGAFYSDAMIDRALKGGGPTASGESKPGTIGSGDAVDRALGMRGMNMAQAGAALKHAMHFGAWCADFTNGIIEQGGGKGSGSALARSFMGWGRGVPLSDVRKNDVAVLNGGHHVGMFTGERQADGRLGVVAGNTRDGRGGHDVEHYFVRPESVFGARRGEDPDEAEARRRAMQIHPAAAAHPERHAAGVDFDGSSIRDALHHVRELKRELADMRGGAKVAVEHTHKHEHEHMAAAGGSPPGGRFSPFRSHAGAPAGRIIV